MLTALLVLAFAASMTGGLAPAVEGLLERLGLERVVSFRSGLLVAVALADVLPEAWAQSRPVCAAAAAGALLLGWSLHRGHAHEHEGHELTHPHVHAPVRGQRAAAVGAMLAHSLTDGLNLGATALVGGPALLAVGTATVLHKFADGFTVTTLYHDDGPPRGALLPLLAVSLATPAGAWAGRAGALSLGPAVTALLLGFAGGSFLYVGGMQIVPHLSRRRDPECAWSFAAGAAAMLVLRRLAP